MSPQSECPVCRKDGALLNGEVVCGTLNCMNYKKPVTYTEEYLKAFAKGSPCFTNREWEALLEVSFNRIRQLAKAKGGEYSGDTDRLANFRRNGTALALPKETIWAIYAAKHWDAIMQFIVDQRVGTTRERMEPIVGRIDDLLVYLLLLKAMVQEGAQ